MDKICFTITTTIYNHDHVIHSLIVLAYLYEIKNYFLVLLKSYVVTFKIGSEATKSNTCNTQEAGL